MKKRILIVLAILALLSLTVLAACEEKHEHAWSPKSDGTNHWEECECGEKRNEAAHQLSWVSTDASNHWQKCDCGYTTTPAAHSDGDDADELCDACGRNLHQHDYSIVKSDAINHWNECSCGEKQTASVHVDEKNNQTNADGADGKCDVCEHEIFAVTFDMQGHGQSVSAQNVGKGGHAVAPQAPSDDDSWKFKGWYKEASCEHAFDFENEVINSATTVYAKWEDDTTEGASKNHAFALVLGEESSDGIKKDAPNYYVYTAVKDGRYTVSLGSGLNSLKCTFTTDKTGETSFDKDNYSVNLDLAVGEKIYIVLNCGEELASDAVVGVLIDECTDEPLPADLFPSGEYGNDTYSFEFDHDKKEIVYNEQTLAVKFVGGKQNKLIVIQDLGTLGKNEFVISVGENGAYQLSVNGQAAKAIQYTAPQDPIPVAKFAGLYKPAKADKLADNISEIGVYSDGSGYIVQNGFKNAYQSGSGASYNQKRNALTLGQYTLTLNLDGENVVSVNVSGGNVSAAVVYNRSGAPLPKSLPLSSKQYAGEQYCLTKNAYGDGFRWGTYDYTGTIVEITAYDEEKEIYTVANGETIYQLKIVENSVELYDETGENKLDTLVAFVPVIHEMPANGAALTINKADFQKNFYWIKVSASDWYLVEVTGEQTIVYVGLSEDDPTNIPYNIKQAGAGAIKLEADVIIGVYLGNYEEVPESVTLTVTKTEAPAGMSAEKPLDLVDGKAVYEGMDNENVYYFRYTGLKAGTYIVGCTYDSYGRPAPVHFVINGEQYGYVESSGDYLGEVTLNFPYASITVAENGNLIIAVDRKGAWGEADVTVMVTEDYRQGASSITADSGTLQAGNYKIDDLADVESLVLGEGADSKTLTKDQLLFGIKVENSVKYVINYVLGSESNPVVVNGEGTVQVLGGQYVTVTAPASADVTVSLGSVDSWGETIRFSFEYNGVTYGYEYSYSSWSYVPLKNVSLAVSAGQSVTIHIIEDGSYSEEIPLIVARDYTKNAIDVEFVNGAPADDKIIASATVSASGTYCISSTSGAITVTSNAVFTLKMIDGSADVVAQEAEGVFSAQINASKGYFIVTLADGQSLSLSVEYAKGSEVYPDEIELVQGEASVPLGFREEHYIVLPAGTYKFASDSYYANAQVWINGKNVGLNVAVTIAADDVVMLLGGYSLETITISVAEPEPEQPVIEGTVYEGTSEMGLKYTLTLKEDYTQGLLVIVDTNIDEEVFNEIVAIVEKEGAYTFSYTLEGFAIDVSFLFGRTGDDRILWTETVNGADDPSFELVKKAEEQPDTPSEGIVYIGSITDNNDNVTNVKVILSEDGHVVYSCDVGSGYEEIANVQCEINENVYTGSYDMDTLRIVVSADGNTIEFTDSYSGTGTLIKQA